MKKIIGSLGLISLLFSTPALAIDDYFQNNIDYILNDYIKENLGIYTIPVPKEPSHLKANLRRFSLDISSTQVSNAKEYQDSSNSQLAADSETVTKWVLDFILEYSMPNGQWNNSIFAEYGKTRQKDPYGEKSTNENADKILLTTDYARKMWRYKEADVGPFVNLGYQTEFSADDDSPLTKIIRGKTGLKLFNGVYIKDLYLAGIVEEDLTYSETNTKYGYEIGTRIEYPLRDGVKFQIDSYFRDYVHYSHYQGSDFLYEFNTVSRMEVEIANGFTVAPFMSFLQAQSREAENKGSNFMVGVSIGFSNIYDIF